MVRSKAVGQKAFDFAAIAAKLPASARGQFGNLRGQYGVLKAKLDQLPAEKAAIDFGAYNFTSVLSKNVPEIKKIYDGAKVEYPAADIASIDAKQKTTLAAADALIKASEARLASLEAQLAALHAEAPLTEMSTDQYLADKPDLKAKIAADLEKGAFM